MRKNKYLFIILFLFIAFLLNTACGNDYTSNNGYVPTTKTTIPVETGVMPEDGQPTALTEPDDDISFITGTIFKNSMENENKLIERKYTAPKSGTYRFDFIFTTNASAKIKFYIYDDAGRKEVEKNYLGDGEGVTVELTQGKTYLLNLKQNEYKTEFEMHIGVPNETRKILSDEIKLHDSINYIDQCNHYEYLAPVNGRYRFDLDVSDNTADTYITIKSSNNSILQERYLSGSTGVTVDLSENEKYDIFINQEENFTQYDILIGVPQSPVNINGNHITGSVSYEDEIDVYYFKVPLSGTYVFDVETSDATAGLDFKVDDNKKSTISNNYVKNGYSKKINLEHGVEYTAYVSQSENFCSYNISFSFENKS